MFSSSAAYSDHAAHFNWNQWTVRLEYAHLCSTSGFHNTLTSLGITKFNLFQSRAEDYATIGYPPKSLGMG